MFFVPICPAFLAAEFFKIPLFQKNLVGPLPNRMKFLVRESLKFLLSPLPVYITL